jgi:hypothetical protein
METNEIGQCNTAKGDITKNVKGWLQIGIIRQNVEFGCVQK